MLVGFGVALIMALAASTQGQDDVHQRRQQDIEVCRLEYLDVAKTERYRVSLGYALTTNAVGRVTQVVPLQASRTERALQPKFSALEPCVQRWLLRPASKYKLSVTYGTTEEPTEFRLTPEVGDIVNIVVPSK